MTEVYMRSMPLRCRNLCIKMYEKKRARADRLFLRTNDENAVVIQIQLSTNLQFTVEQLKVKRKNRNGPSR